MSGSWWIDPSMNMPPPSPLRIGCGGRRVMLSTSVRRLPSGHVLAQAGSLGATVGERGGDALGERRRRSREPVPCSVTAATSSTSIRPERQVPRPRIADGCDDEPAGSVDRQLSVDRVTGQMDVLHVLLATDDLVQHVRNVCRRGILHLEVDELFGYEHDMRT